MTYPVQRPLGVTILTILQVLSGIMDIVAGVLLLIVYALAIAVIGVGASTDFAFLLVPLSVLLFAFGAASFLIAYGLWKGKVWGWNASVFVAAIGLVLSSLGLLFGNFVNLIPIVIDAIILLYLSSYNVRVYFGRVGPQAPFAPRPPYPQPPPGGILRSQPIRSGWKTCITCGNPIAAGANFCDRCGTQLR